MKEDRYKHTCRKYVNIGTIAVRTHNTLGVYVTDPYAARDRDNARRVGSGRNNIVDSIAFAGELSGGAGQSLSSYH